MLFVQFPISHNFSSLLHAKSYSLGHVFILQKNHEIKINFRDKKELVVILTKLEIILETNFFLVSKLVSIIVK